MAVPIILLVVLPLGDLDATLDDDDDNADEDRLLLTFDDDNDESVAT